MSKFSVTFKRLREQSGLTQQEMGDALGISRSAVGMYEQGKREPDFKTLEKIADYFNVSMVLLEDKKNEDNPPDRCAARLMAYLNLLNEAGKEEAIQRLEELTYLPKYRKKED